jgi:hypothetical protein
MDGQAKINKDTVTKFEALEKTLENLDGKVTEVRSSIREVFIMMKMLETRVGQLVGHPMGNKGVFPHQGARHSTVDHGHPSDGVFHLHLWVLPSRWSIPLRRSPSSL